MACFKNLNISSNMKETYLSLLLIIFILSSTAGFSNPSRKTWWTKRVTSDNFHTAGRLTSRQIKYASEAGFKTIVSLFTFNEQQGGNGSYGGSYYPTTSDAKEIAEDLANIKYATVLESDDWKTSDTVRTLHEIVRDNAKPLLFHCDNSYASSFVLLAYLANVTNHGDNQNDEPEISGADVFRIGTQLGYNYAKENTLKQLISDLVDPDIKDYPESDVSSEDWYLHYWQMKPVYKNFYISGQFQRNDLNNIGSAGVKSIANARRGLTVPVDTPSQEEVTLLNIKDRTGTYTGNDRQTTTELESNRLDPGKPTTYISPDSMLNYESRNALEFGDDIGYNEEWERTALANELPDIRYVHLPLGGQYGYRTNMWQAYKNTILSLGRNEMVLFQCRTGYRSSVMALLSAAYMNCFSSEWAIQRAAEIGYEFQSSAPAVITLFQDVLDGRNDLQKCIENRGRITQRTVTESYDGSGNTHSKTFTALVTMLLAIINIL